MSSDAEASPPEQPPPEQPPAKTTQAEQPSEATHSEATPLEATRVEATRVEATPVDATPVEATRVEATPTEQPPIVAKTIRLAEPTRLHVLSWLFEIISLGRKNLIPAAVALFGAASGGLFGMYVAMSIFIPLALYTLIRFLTVRYSISNGELTVSEGLLWRRVRSVPVNRIQNIDLIQGVLHRVFKVAEVRIETASGSEPEATLRVLSLERVEALRNEISKLTSQEQPAASENATGDQSGFPENAAAPAAELVIQSIPTSLLVKAGLASNRGMLLVGLLVGIFYQFELYERFNFDDLIKLIPKNWNTWTIILAATITFVIAFVIIRLVGVAWHILRFYDYRLTRDGDDLKISCGLLTKVSATVPRRRIQFISIHRPLLYRWLGLATIRIETAGGAAKSNEDAAATVARRWFVPVLPVADIPRIIGEVRPGLQWSEAIFEWHPLAKRTATRLVRIAIVKGVVLSAIGCGIGFMGFFLTPVWGALCGALLLPGLIVWAIRKSKAMHYGRADFGVAFRSGILNHKTSVTFFDKIQTLRSSQSPFDRRWKMASLDVDTAAAGPAEHLIHVAYLDETFAREEFLRLNKLAAQHKPAWI